MRAFALSSLGKAFTHWFLARFEHNFHFVASEEPKRPDPIAYYTGQYSQAVQAFETIRVQSDTFRMMGNMGELRGFLDQFIEMASKTAADAHLQQLDRIAGWFLELVQKAEKMKKGLDQPQ